MVSLDYLRKKHQELRGDAPANTDFLEKYLQLSVGPNDIRILPGADEQERFFAETKIHRIPQGNSVRNVHCLKTHNKPCPLDRKSTRLNSSHPSRYRMPSSA